MSDTAKHADKIRKMMALAQDSGATPEEAANAAAMAAELALKHNLDLAQVMQEGQPKKKAFTHLYATEGCGPRDRAAGLLLSHGLSRLYGCMNLVSWAPPTNKYSFVGQEHNAQLCASWFDYLWRSCERANKEYNKTLRGAGRTAKERGAADQAFRLRFAEAVTTRLLQKLREMREKGVQQSNGTALMVVDWYEQEYREVQEYAATKMRVGKAAKTRTSVRDSHAGAAGAEAGKRVSLDAQLTSSQSVRAALR